MIGFAMMLAVAPMTDAEVYRWCAAPEASIDGLSCTAFVSGAIGGALAANEMQRLPPPFCIPGNVTQRGLEVIVVAYLEKHPEYKTRDSAGIVVAAIHNAFPCAKS